MRVVLIARNDPRKKARWLMRLWSKEGEVRRIKGRCSEQNLGYTCLCVLSSFLHWIGIIEDS